MSLPTDGFAPPDTEHPVGGEPPPSWLFDARSLGSSFRIYLPTVAVVRAIGLFRVLLFGFLILQSEYGLLRLGMLLVNVFAALARLGVPAGLERYVPAYERTGQLRAFVRRGVMLGLAGAAVLIGGSACLAGPLARLAFGGPAGDAGPAPGAGYLVRLTLVCLGVILLTVLYFNLQGVLRGLRMYRALAVQETLHGLSFLLLAIAALLLGGTDEAGGAMVVMVAYGGSLLLPAAWLGVGLRRYLRRWAGQARPLDAPWRKTAAQVLRFSSFLMMAGLLWQVLLLFGQWLLNKWHGRAEAGLFAYPRDLMQWVMLMSGAIWLAAQNSANRLWEHGRHVDAMRQLGTVFRTSSWAMWLGSGLIVLCARPIVAALPGEYAQAGPLLAWFLVFFLMLNNLGLPHAQARLLENSRVLFIAASAGLVVHVATSLWLVPAARGPGAGPDGLAALRVAQSAVLAAAAAGVAVWAMVLWIARGRTWATPRDAACTLAPLLLLLPWLSASAGAWALAGAMACVVALLGGTRALLDARDRAAVHNYARYTFQLLLRRG